MRNHALSIQKCWPLLLVLLAAACSPPALNPVNVDSNGVAIKGYDPVAYFVLGGPRPGSSAFEHTWQGATWRFANAHHLELFKAAPEKYAPQYGGY